MPDHTVADPVEELLGEIHAALDRAAERATVALDPDERRSWFCGLQAVRSRVDALCCQAAADAERSALPRIDGLFSVGSLLARHTNSDAAVAGPDRRLGRWLADFDQFARAFAEGLLTRRHVEVLRRATNPRTYGALLAAQEWFLDAARRLGFREFTVALRYWVLAADPDGEEPVHQVARRNLSLGKDADGMVTGRFVLDPISGQALATAIGQEAQRLMSDDAESATPRGTGQRQADALVGLVTRGATRPDGRAPTPLVHLVMSQTLAEALLSRSPAEAAGSSPLPLDAERVDGRCELVDGTPVHPRYGAELLTVARLRRLVLGADGEVLDLSRAVRLYPPHLKQALLAAARGRCQVPACDAPVPWLQADHVLPWIRGHPTAVANGQICCGPHNRAKSDRPAA